MRQEEINEILNNICNSLHKKTMQFVASRCMMSSRSFIDPILRYKRCKLQKGLMIFTAIFHPTPHNGLFRDPHSHDLIFALVAAFNCMISASFSNLQKPDAHCAQSD